MLPSGDAELARRRGKDLPPPTIDDSAAFAREIIDAYGGDAVRLALLHGAPTGARLRLRAEDVFPWVRFLGRVWRQATLRVETGRFVSKRVLVMKHRLVLRVSERLRRFQYHTAVAAIAEFVRFLGSADVTDEEVDRSALETFCVLLSPFAPFLAQEIWKLLGHDDAVGSAPWPEYSEELVAETEPEIPVWAGGRVVALVTHSADESPEQVRQRAFGIERVERAIEGRSVDRVLSHPGQAVVVILAPAEAAEPVADSPVE